MSLGRSQKTGRPAQNPDESLSQQGMMGFYGNELAEAIASARTVQISEGLDMMLCACAQLHTACMGTCQKRGRWRTPCQGRLGRAAWPSRRCSGPVRPPAVHRARVTQIRQQLHGLRSSSIQQSRMHSYRAAHLICTAIRLLDACTAHLWQPIASCFDVLSDICLQVAPHVARGCLCRAGEVQPLHSVPTASVQSTCALTF